MRGKSRHYRDESDPLLGLYAQNLAESSSIRNPSNPLYASTDIFSSPKEGSNGKGTLNDSNLSQERLLLLQQQLLVSNEGNDDIKKCDDGQSSNIATNLLRRPSFLGYNQTRKDNVVSKENGSHGSNNNNNNGATKARQKASRPKGYRVHRVSYTAQDHIQVMFRLYGSAFPNVFPFVVVNVIWCCLVYLLKRYNIFDLTFHSSVGHSFMGLLVSFLIVSRSQISYSRFMEYRKLLASSYRVCREIAQFSTVYTFYTNTTLAQEWRQEVCYRTILMLRVTMDALLWSSCERGQWEDEYYQYQLEEYSLINISTSSNTDEDEQEVMEAGFTFSRIGLGPGQDATGDTGGESDNVSDHFFRFRDLTHGRRSRIDETFRAPITFMHVLRNVIMDHPQYLGYKMAVNEYRDLLDFVTKFDEFFHGFRVLVFTPYPFPLVQMTRGFLFFWVYTLPLVLLVGYRLWSSLLIVILVTFGFVGIEYVSMALDDPFADDTNDVDEHGMSLLVYEDIYMALYRTDGPEAAMALRERVLDQYRQGRALDCYRDDLKGYDFWEGAQARHDRIGPCPDWSSNPPPTLSTESVKSVSDIPLKSAGPTSRRRPPKHRPVSFQDGIL